MPEYPWSLSLIPWPGGRLGAPMTAPGSGSCPAEVSAHTAAHDPERPFNRRRAPIARSTPRMRQRACSTAPPRSAPDRGWPRSACARKTSTAPPTSPPRPLPQSDPAHAGRHPRALLDDAFNRRRPSV
jgi:hypothetical protein